MVETSDLERLKAEIIDLERLEYTVMRRIASRARVRPDTFWVEAQMIGEEIALEVHGFVWGTAREVRKYEFAYPADWWQAVKARWFPAWLKRYFPVRYYVKSIDVRMLFPDLRVPDDVGRVSLAIYRVDKQEVGDNGE